MITSFDKERDIDYTIVPKLQAPNFMRLTPGDTLVAHGPKDWDIDGLHQLYDLLESAFPNNNILVLPYGIKLEVIEERNSNEAKLSQKSVWSLYQDHQA